MLISVYETGSKCILPHFCDEDFVFYYETKEEALEALRKNHNRDADIHFDVFGEEPKVFLGCYIYPYMKLVKGQKKNFDSFSIFNTDTKRKYINLLKKYVAWLKNDSKLWYHIVIAYYLFKKNKYSLSEEEIQNAQFIHDNGITEQFKNKIGGFLCREI